MVIIVFCVHQPVTPLLAPVLLPPVAIKSGLTKKPKLSTHLPPATSFLNSTADTDISTSAVTMGNSVLACPTAAQAAALATETYTVMVAAGTVQMADGRQNTAVTHSVTEVSLVSTVPLPWANTTAAILLLLTSPLSPLPCLSM